MSDRDHAAPALPMARIVLHRRLLVHRRGPDHRAAAPHVPGFLLAREPDRLRDQHHAGHQPRFYSRLRGTAQSRSLGVLRHRRLCLDVAHHAARRAILDCVRARHRIVGRRRNGAVAVRGASARPLSRNRVARLCRHRPSGAAELDQPDARAARHLCDQAAAGDCPAGIAASISFSNSANMFYLVAGFAFLSICCSTSSCARRSARP